ncbi:hypothetical protein GGI12_002948 [Dipsacomyces acuminosporus]|nr:hypothetical protein GGI12_002948 [Dipsacomyces acuminosporus]
MSKTSDPLSTPKPATYQAFDKELSTPQPHDQEQQQQQQQQQLESSNSTIAQTSGTADSSMSDSQAPVQAYAKLEGPDFCYYVRTLEVTLGRHPTSEHHDPVDIDLGLSKAVSRRHAKIYYNFMTQSFELQVFGKNGCLVDDEYYEKGQCVSLRHRMVIQVGDTEFAFLLPKSAVSGASNDGTGSAAAANAAPLSSGTGPIGHPDVAPGLAGTIALSQPAQNPMVPGGPSRHDHAYPINAITPQRLNLYSANDPSNARNARAQQQVYLPNAGYSGSPRFSPTGSIPHDHEPPAPLSFEDAQAQNPQTHPHSGRNQLYGSSGSSNNSANGADAGGIRSEAHGAYDSALSSRLPPPPHPSSSQPLQQLQQHQLPPISPGRLQQQSMQKPRPAMISLPERGPQPLYMHQQQQYQLAPQNAQNAQNGAQLPGARPSNPHVHSEIRILPATEKPTESPSGGSRKGDFIKPTYSYASLIAQAINSTEDKKVTLNGIYNYIMANYPYYKHAQNGWQNSIRHNLSLNKAFIKVLRASNEPGKGSYWAIDDAYKGQFSNGVYKRTRRTKKAMELERERERQRVMATNPNAESSQNAGAKRGAHQTPAAAVAALGLPQSTTAFSSRSDFTSSSSTYVAGGKRPQPEDENDYATGDDGRGDDAAGGSYRRLSDRHPAKRSSVGTLSTGEETADYVSSAQSNNGSNPNSLPDSPRQESKDEQPHPARPPPPPPPAAAAAAAASGTLRVSNSSVKTRGSNNSPVKQPPTTSASSSYIPTSSTLPSSSRPSQPRPQQSLAR